MRSLFLAQPFWIAGALLVAGWVLAYVFPFLFPVVNLLALITSGLVAADIFALYRIPKGIFARRSLAARFSNGDENPVTLFLENRYPFTVSVAVIDEIPHQFQRRDILFNASIPPGTERHIHYSLRPVRRGVYAFGSIHVFVKTPLGFVERRYRSDTPQEIAVYPSFLQMRQYALLAVANRLSEAGIKKVRRIGHSMEFDQIRTYVPGDDRRTVNWNATARKGELMVNAYEDLRRQSVYCVIDKGRTMQSPFEALTLLDYAINATLVMSTIILQKDDKAGLVTFSDTPGQFLPAARRTGHLQQLLETLYRQKTRFLEADYERLCLLVKKQITHRSLLLLFTNFETVEGMQRQLPYLRRLAKDHLLVVIFFENTETRQLLEAPAVSVEQLYQKTIAQRFHYEKKQIASVLRRYGIQTILTAPQQLTVNTINRYLELKARGAV